MSGGGRRPRREDPKRRAKRTADERFMRRALELARRGGPRVSPNPKVGCVLVRKGRVVGEGYHARFAGPHAEALALAAAGSAASGATAYVTLEPCGHRDKKTPPCAQALAAAGVRRAVIGVRDPNPSVSGKGTALLRRAGLDVTEGTLGRECLAVNRAFRLRMRGRRPYVILKAAASLDGRIETGAGRSRWITSPPARRAGHRMRASVDAILVGIGTILTDDPSLTSHGAGRDPLRVVLDGRLRMPPRARVLDGRAPTLVFTSVAGASRRRATPPHAAAFLRVPARRGLLDLRAVLARLSAMGVGSLLVEGGSRVHSSFLQEGLVDELRLFLSPRLIGGAGARSFFEGRGYPMLDRAPRLEGLRVRRVGRDLLLSGRLTSKP